MINISERAARVFDAIVPLLFFALWLILILTIARCLLVGWQLDRILEADMLLPVILQGLRFDLVLVGIVASVAALCFPIFASNSRLIGIWRAFCIVYFPLALLLALFMELSTPSFMQEFDSRPNILFVEYLNHPREVFSMLWAAYRETILMSSVAMAIVAVFLFRRFAVLVNRTRPTGVATALVVTPVLLLICAGLIRSTLDHRPVNPSTVALSTDPLVNDLALNSTYSLLYAIYETRHENRGGFRYADMDESTVISTVRSGMDVDSWDFTSTNYPTLHIQRPTVKEANRSNIVIIVEESLGAEFVGSLGGTNLTPNLDRYSKEGIWLSNLYATGTRSVRGLEAIVSGFTPTPARSVVKLGKSQRNFFTLAEVLGREGYDTSFIYGGEAQFDNMRRFFVNNGFKRVVDEKDYVNPVFRGSWGVSDEDLFERAHLEFMAAGDRPFFSLVFTSSNHSPFEYPDGRIKPIGESRNTVENAVQYADFALGQFLDKARDSSYWKNTVFLVVADHNSRVYGKELVPVQRFHIPGLILGGSIEPQRIDTVASQIDLAPTLLSLIGLTAEHPMIGYDLSKPANRSSSGRAVMQFNGAQAYMRGDHVAVLQKNAAPLQFLYQQGHLVAAGEYDTNLTNSAIALASWSSLAYEKSLYRLPELDATLTGWLTK